MRAVSLTLAAASALAGVSNAATTEEWKSRAIYQVMVDRFALTDGSTSQECEDLSQFCNGTWTGLINHLDYIQGMYMVQILPSAYRRHAQREMSCARAYARTG